MASRFPLTLTSIPDVTTTEDGQTLVAQRVINPVLESLPPADLCMVIPGTIKTSSLTNPRSAVLEDQSQRELLQSIQQHGVLQPVIARGLRPLQEGETWQELELVAGHRRLLAARQLGLPEIPVLCYARSDMTDQRALEVALVENLHRKDQRPMDESRAYRVLQEKHCLTMEDIAAHVGRSLAHVHRRLLLNTLALDLQVLLDAGWMTIGAAEQLSRASDYEQQRRAMVQAFDGSVTLIDSVLERLQAGKEVTALELQVTSPVTVARARAALSKVSRDIATAPWSPDDATLVPLAGACSSCPKRTRAQETLFGAADANLAVDACMDSGCWDAKQAAFLKLQLAQAKANGWKILSRKESRQLYGDGSSTLVTSNVIDIDQPCEIPRTHNSWRAVASEILGDADRTHIEHVVAIDGKGMAHTLVDRKALLRAAKASGLIKPEKKPARDGDDARRANERADAKRAQEFSDAILKTVMLKAGAEGISGAEHTSSDHFEAQLWELVVRALFGRATHGTKRELARVWTKDLPAGTKPMPVEEVESVLQSDLSIVTTAGRAKALALLALQLCVCAEDWTFYSKGREGETDERFVQPALKLAADLFAVDTEKIAKKLAVQSTKKPARQKTLAAKIKKKAEKKAKSKKRARHGKS